MRTVIKTLAISDAVLNVISAGRRMPAANFSGQIEIEEHSTFVNILGRRCRGEKRIQASFILAEDMEYHTDLEFHSGMVYEAIGKVQGEHRAEQLLFSGLRFEDMDPVSGRVTFEVTDLELIRKMLRM